jgi:hypothetical protein
MDHVSGAPRRANRLILALGVALAAAAAVAVALASTAGAGKSTPTTIPAGALLPDLQTVVPTHLNLVNQQQRDKLRFSNGIANTGAGPLALRPEHVGEISNGWQEFRDADGNVLAERLASQYEFHAAHNHWHLGDVALFEIRKGSPTGPIVNGNQQKVTFCLIDWYKLSDNSPTREKTFWDCEQGYQGISAGWVDQYHHALEGQSLDLTGAPNGNDYYLVSTANHARKFTETDYTNNTAWVRFTLSQDSQGNRKVVVTGNSPCANAAMCGIGAPNR